MQNKDTDLREALKRKYANTPLLPADFMANMEKRLENHGDRSRDSKKNHGPVPMIRWVAVAASLLILVGVGLTIIPTTENQTAPDALIAQQTEKAPQAEMPTTSSEESISPKPADSQSEASGLSLNSLLSISKKSPQQRKVPLSTSIPICITHRTKQRRTPCPIRIQPVWTSSSPNLPIITR